MDSPSPFGIGTLLAHLGEEDKVQGAVVAPIFQNSLFLFEDVAELLKVMGGEGDAGAHGYSRLSNPSLEALETKLAAMEGTEGAKFFGCGQAALTVAILQAVQTGSHVVAVDTAYAPVRQLLAEYLDRFGVTHTLVTGLCADEVIDAIRPDTAVVYLESPSSVLMRMQDVARIAQAARERGAITVFDNTYNTPLHMNPAAHGIDLVCHSASKYLAGHSDIIAGAICGRADVLNRIVLRETNLLGNILHPFQAWLLMRGMRTLEVRLKRHEASANLLAAWLEERPEVAQVHHLGLPSYSQRDLVRAYLRGTGGLFSFEPKTQDFERIRAFCNALKLFGRGVSWGGYESLVIPLPVKPGDYDERRWVVRLFIGLEAVDDLRADLERALPLLAE